MVIGNEVVGSLQYDNPPNDFRTNASDDSHPRITKFGSDVEHIAVSSVRSAGMELGGVDVIFRPDGKVYLLEMNMPCGFATFPKLGIDVPGMMVEYLLMKAKSAPFVQAII
jgi:glutathione synthase/RimK-type ligase-like ATP-grasp enzyme